MEKGINLRNERTEDFLNREKTLLGTKFQINVILHPEV